MALKNVSTLIRYAHIAFIAVACFLAGCEKQKDIDTYLRSPIPEERRLPVDYVLLLDNSGSIPEGEARVFARDAIKAFIDLAEDFDKITLISFDEEAQIIASGIVRTQDERERLKSEVDTNIDFQGNYSDISKATNLLRENMGTVFRGNGIAKPVVLLISDGKLETKTDLAAAYQTLLSDWGVISEIIPFYTLGMGERDIYQQFLPNVSGYTLLTWMAKESNGAFFPIKSVNDLVSAYVSILKLTKGYGELKDCEVFDIDESTQRLALIVMKRFPDRIVCRTGDIRLKNSRREAISFNNSPVSLSKVSWRMGAYYDLIIVEKPAQGRWSLELENRSKPYVAAMVKNQVHLRYLVRSGYWDREKKQITAWLYDERTGRISQRPCRMKMTFDRALPSSNNTLDLHRTSQSTYAADLRINGKEPTSGKYLLRISAENSSDTFSRISPVLGVEVVKSYFSLEVPSGVFYRWPYFWKGIEYSFSIDTTHKACPRLIDPPRIMVSLRRVEEKKVIDLPVITLPARAEGREIQYRLRDADIPVGRYIGSITMDGRTSSGRTILIKTPDFGFTVKRPFWVWVGLFVIGLALFTLLGYLLRPKLTGRLDFQKPLDREWINLARHKKAKKAFRGDSLVLGASGDDLDELLETSFTITAARRKGLRVRVKRGAITLMRDDQVRSVAACDVYRGDILSFTDNGKEYEIEVICPKRVPRKKGMHG